MLTPAQLATFKAALLAETDANVVQWRTPETRDDRSIANWYNAESATYAWGNAVKVDVVDQVIDYSTYDSKQQGSRDSWALFLRPATRDFGNSNTRKWVNDVWTAGTANASAVMNAALVKAKRIEVALGGTNKTSSGVTALVRDFVGNVSIDDVSVALNS